MRRIINKDGTETIVEIPQSQLNEWVVAQKQSRIAEIKSRLNQIDIESIRPIRTIQKGVGAEFDTQKIAELEIEAETLRQELRDLKKK